VLYFNHNFYKILWLLFSFRTAIISHNFQNAEGQDIQNSCANHLCGCETCSLSWVKNTSFLRLKTECPEKYSNLIWMK